MFAKHVYVQGFAEESTISDLIYIAWNWLRIFLKDGVEGREQRAAAVVLFGGADGDDDAAAAQEAAALLAGLGGEHRQPHQRLPHSGPRVHALPAELIQVRYIFINL